MTAYHFECTDKFDENLELLLKFVSTPYFTAESVEKEQGIIGQEIRMTEDDPDHAIYYALLRDLYKYNPMKDAIAGTVESIAEITPEVLNACHRVFYNPNNMVLCVAGDQDPEKIAETARNILPKTRGPIPEKDHGKKESLKPVNRRSEVVMEVGMPTFLMGAKDGECRSGDDLQRRELIGELALEIIAGKSSALYARLYNDGLINGSFSAEYETTAGEAFVVMGGESRDPDAAFKELSDAAREVGEKGVDKALFERQKKAAIGRRLRELNSFENICYSTARGYFMGYDPFRAIDVLSGITGDDVRSFAAETLSDERLALAIIRG
jgi:predicted Zn-dependent peptidase